MKIETKYDVGDKVWVVEQSYGDIKYYAKSAFVWMLKINVYEKEKSYTSYNLRGYMADVFMIMNYSQQRMKPKPNVSG